MIIQHSTAKGVDESRTGHALDSTTARYPYAARTSYPDAAHLAEARLFVEG